MIAAFIDAASILLALHIIVVGVGRLALMSWRTHRKSWQIIYLALVIGAAWFLRDMAINESRCASVPLLALLAATAAWFHESRDRWKTAAPPYMLSAATFRNNRS